MQGYVHVYTGNGKGKTTAALGLAVRAAGAGKKVFFAQFVKGQIYSEVQALQQFLPAIEIKQYGLSCFIHRAPFQADIDAARAGLEEVVKIIAAGDYDVVVLDEITIAIYYDLLSANEIIELLRTKPAAVEIVITGRYAPPELIAAADLVTEMQEVKHYYTSGVESRPGIDC